MSKQGVYGGGQEYCAVCWPEHEKWHEAQP